MMENADRKMVATDGDRVVGFARAICDGVSNGYIGTVAVAEDKRNCGIGRGLVTRLMGDDPSITWVLRAGRGSEAFWQKWVSSPLPSRWSGRGCLDQFPTKSYATQFRYEMELREQIVALVARDEFGHDDRELFEQFKSALRRGEIRSAEKDSEGNWHANTWVKQGILLGFRMGQMVEMSKPSETFVVLRQGDIPAAADDARRQGADRPRRFDSPRRLIRRSGCGDDAAVLHQCRGIR